MFITLTTEANLTIRPSPPDTRSSYFRAVGRSEKTSLPTDPWPHRSSFRNRNLFRRCRRRRRRCRKEAHRTPMLRWRGDRGQRVDLLWQVHSGRAVSRQRRVGLGMAVRCRASQGSPERMQQHSPSNIIFPLLVLLCHVVAWVVNCRVEAFWTGQKSLRNNHPSDCRESNPGLLGE